MTKKDTNIQTMIKRYSSEAGLTIMAIATVIGLMELPEHNLKQAIISPQPVKYSNYNQNNQSANPLRREKEENSIEYVSYAEAERTPARSGRY